MKRGTILINPSVSEGHPFKKSIYMGVNGKYFETWYVCNGKLEKVRFHKCDLKEFIVDGYSSAFINFIKNLSYDLEV